MTATVGDTAPGAEAHEPQEDMYGVGGEEAEGHVYTVTG